MIYLDNGATSFPKPKEVIDAVTHYMQNVGININRGTHSRSYSAENIVYETRELISDFFGFDNPDNVVFTKNITESLNTLIFGLLKPGDHAVVSSLEHNSVMRPLSALLEKGITFDRAECKEDGLLDIEDFKKKLKHNTKAVIMTHASNVCGTVLDLETVGKICKERGIFFIVDTAQTAGSLLVKMDKLNANAIAFTAHKGLLAPQGLGGFIVDSKINPHISPLIFGGTGSISQSEIQPSFMPDKFESGTQNLPAIFGLNAAIKYLNKTGIENIHEKEMQLTKRLIDGLSCIDGLKIIGEKGIENRTSAVSITLKGSDLGQVAHKMSKEADIMVRCGLHCSPSAHKALKTFPEGTIRMSIGQFNTDSDVDICIKFFREL
jgi:cysteine desulfurase family protein